MKHTRKNPPLICDKNHLVRRKWALRRRSIYSERCLVLSRSVEAAAAASTAPADAHVLADGGRLGGALPALTNRLGRRVHLVVGLQRRVDAAVALVGARVGLDRRRAHHGELALAIWIVHPHDVLGDVDHASEPVVAWCQPSRLEYPLGEPGKMRQILVFADFVLTRITSKFNYFKTQFIGLLKIDIYFVFCNY